MSFDIKKHLNKIRLLSIKCNKDKSAIKFETNKRDCKFCGKPIELARYSVSQTLKKKFCNHSCAAKFNNSLREYNKSKETPSKKCKSCNTEIPRHRVYCSRECYHKPYDDIRSETTKGNLKDKHGSRDYSRWIRVDAKGYVTRLKIDRKCSCCGYLLFTEICHIKPVKDFSDNCTLIEINDLSNLCLLCPNHHKELDGGLLDVTTIKTVKDLVLGD